MPYLIDGHNLIGKMPGIALDDLDDERQLIQWLQAFANRSRRRVHVFFDRRAPGADPPPSSPRLVVRFVRAPRSADDAILAELRRIGPQASNWTLVTSDRALADAARRMGARILASEDFARQLQTPGTSAPSGQEKPAPPTHPDEIARWEQLFQRKKPPQAEE